MIESMTLTKAVTGETLAINDSQLPIDVFDTEVIWRQEDNEKAGQHGQWGSYPFMGKRLIRIEGDIIRDTSTNYWAKRRDLLKMFDPYPGQTKLGTLDLELTGFSEHLFTDINLDGYPEIPIAALSPSAGRFMISFKCDDPYLYGSLVTESIVAKTVAKTVANGGNAISTNFMGVISDTCINPTITHNDLAKSITIGNLNMAASDTLEIDFYKRTIYHVIGSDRIQKFKTAGDWFWLRPGNNSLTLTTAATSGVNEIQQIEVIADGGTYTLTWGGNTTANIPWDAQDFDVQQALEDLASLAVGDVVVTEISRQVYATDIDELIITYEVEFTGTKAAANQAAITGSATNLTSANKAVNILTIQNGSATGTDSADITWKHKNAYLI